MKWPKDLSTLLITESGVLVLDMGYDAEVLGVLELNGRLNFMLGDLDE